MVKEKREERRESRGMNVWVWVWFGLAVNGWWLENPTQPKGSNFVQTNKFPGEIKCSVDCGAIAEPTCKAPRQILEWLLLALPLSPSPSAPPPISKHK